MEDIWATYIACEATLITTVRGSYNTVVPQQIPTSSFIEGKYIRDEIEERRV